MRISTGVTVNVSANTERWLSEIRSGRAFAGSATLAALAANFSHIQLLNPAGSVITIVTRLLTLDLVVVGSAGVGTHNTALTTLAGAGANLLSGGAASVGEIRSQTDVAQLGTYLSTYDLLASSPIHFGGEWILELGAGEGIITSPGAVNVANRTSFLWIEI